MTPKKLTNFRIDDELLEGLEAIRLRDPDWSVSRQVREAIKDWLQKNGVTVLTGPRPARGRRAEKTGSTKRR
jgi:hypothetical protein